MYARGMYKLVKWVDQHYDRPEIYITENGHSSKDTLYDIERVNYFAGELSALLDAIEEGVKVRAYIAWSLTDSFEWFVGFTEKFGLHHVDFTDPQRKRTPKLSAKVYSRICKLNRININIEDLKKEFAHHAKSSASNSFGHRVRMALAGVVLLGLLGHCLVGRM